MMSAAERQVESATTGAFPEHPASHEVFLKPSRPRQTDSEQALSSGSYDVPQTCRHPFHTPSRCAKAPEVTQKIHKKDRGGV